VIESFKGNEVDGLGRRGVLIFTGATASWRGKAETALFAAGKHSIRALSQALNKEFGNDNIHVRLRWIETLARG
jgi:short-subunit dehydrogenase